MRMTDKRKDEMPERVWVHKDAERVIHVAPFETDYPVQAEYIRKDISPPVPDDVAESIERCQRHEDYASDHPTKWGQFRIADVKILVRAASTPSAEVKSVSEEDKARALEDMPPVDLDYQHEYERAAWVRKWDKTLRLLLLPTPRGEG